MAATKRKRPPRIIWAVVSGTGEIVLAERTKKLATEAVPMPRDSWRVVGPYVLAERVRER